VRTEECHGAPLELQQRVRREVGRQHRTHTLPTTQGDTKAGSFRDKRRGWDDFVAATFVVFV
jgi:hypothetical protein